MMRVQLWLLGCLCSVGLVLPAAAETEAKSSAIEAKRLNQIDRPATTVKEWMAQVEAAFSAERNSEGTVQVTGVRVDRTDQGLQVILETASGQPLAATQQAEGNTLILTVPNAVLGEARSFEKPAEGIDRVAVTQADATTIRISITGLNDLPNAEVVPGQGLVLAVTPEEGIEEEVTVTGVQSRYRVPNATTATRTDALILDVPQSIQVIPRQVIEDQGAVELGDALRNVSGVITRNNSQSTTGDGVIIRGFDGGLNSGSYVDGIKRTNINTRRRSTANIERVEVLKGPASVLYGQGEPGGIINVVTKQPLFDPQYNIELTAGNFSFYRPAIDLTGPLNDNKTVRYRINADYINSGSFVDFSKREQFSVTPVLTIDFSENTTLTIDGEYLTETATASSYLPAVGTVLDNPFGRIPRSRFLYYPSLAPQERQFSAIGYRFQHKFNDNWTIRNLFRSEFEQLDESYSFPTLQADNRTLRVLGFLREDAETRFNTLQTDVLGKFNTGSIKHEILIGFEWNRFKTEEAFSTARLPSLDIFEPNYNIPAPVYVRDYDFYSTTQNSIGVYAQNLELCLFVVYEKRRRKGVSC